MKKIFLTLLLILTSSVAAIQAQNVMQVHRAIIGWAGATDDRGNSYTVEFYMDIYVEYTPSNGQMTPTKFAYLGGAHSQIIGGPLLGDYLIRNNPYTTNNETVAHIDWEWDFKRMGYNGTGSNSKTYYLREFPYNPALPEEPAH